ncbi:acyl-CoA N-acyltransferase [Mycena alexandri]|uniref:Acyl-CoA N-acyltransferase n=1 Tax=Mycena alexandri TaxID=1745969 RepID=A0AAD6SJA6_9AGAR|nr:acyl-CoA N-acyltransferase [Mycena alexandri]
MDARLADDSDIPQITNIANHYIQSSVTTFRTEVLPESDILENYMFLRGQGLPYLVAVRQNSPVVLGYAYASGYRMPSHQAYCHTVEITVYVHPERQTIGVGTMLMRKLLYMLKNLGSLQDWAMSSAPVVSEVLCIMALDPDGREAGYGLRDWYIGLGFEEVGRLKRVGFKFGKWIDTLILQMSLKNIEGDERVS